MSDPTAPVEGTPGPAAPEAAPDPWAPVLDRVSELANTVDTRFAELEGRFPQPEPEPEPDPWAALMGESEPEPEPEQYGGLDMAALQQAVDARIQQGIQQAVTPYQQQMQQMQQEAGRAQLIAQIPQLADPEVAKTTIDSMIAEFTAAAAPQEVVAWALNNPAQIAKHFKAAEAEKLSAGQAPAGGEVPSSEAAGGAVPGGNGAQQNIAERVFANRPPQMPSGFR